MGNSNSQQDMYCVAVHGIWTPCRELASLFWQAETQAGIKLRQGDPHVGLKHETAPAKRQQLDATSLHLD